MSCSPGPYALSTIARRGSPGGAPLLEKRCVFGTMVCCVHFGPSCDCQSLVCGVLFSLQRTHVDSNLCLCTAENQITKILPDHQYTAHSFSLVLPLHTQSLLDVQRASIHPVMAGFTNRAIDPHIRRLL